MKTKTIQETDLEQFENKLNEFNEKNAVRATQTHVTAVNQDGMTTFVYTAILYYERKYGNCGCD